MIERITEIANGGVVDKSCEAGCSVDRIEGTINAGDRKTYDFYVIRNDEEPIKGIVYSSDHRVVLKTREFYGHSCRIEYEVDAGRLRNGDVISGQFSIINNCGEWFIPYIISVIYAESQFAESMSSLEKFSALAESNWNEALRLCESSEFLKLPFMADGRCSALYQALKQNIDKNNFLEEFLIGTGAKLPVSISIENTKESFVRSEMRSSDYINIKKDGWGFVQLHVSTDSDFIILNKSTVTAEDFTDGRYALEYKVDIGRLHGGCNLGRIIIEGIRQRFAVNIKIDAKGVQRDRKSAKYRKLTLDCMRYYINYYTGKKDSDKYIDLLKNNLYELIPLDEKNVRIILTIAWTNIVKGDTEDAIRILNRVRGNIMDSGSRVSPEFCICSYLYFIVGGGNENKDTLLKYLHKCYDETGDMAVLRILVKLDTALEEEPGRKLDILKDRFNEGYKSPWIYLESCRLYSEHPELINELGNFELNSLWFGAKEEIISLALAEKAGRLALTVKAGYHLCFRLLEKLYSVHKSAEILRGICSILVRKDIRSERYFKWYAEGIDCDIRVMKLYEYYIYSMPDDFEDPIPRMVLLYFSYTNTLDLLSKIRIYRNIIRYYASDEQIRTCYAGQIESFTIDQLLRGYADEGMAELYNNVIVEDMVDRRIAPVLPKMLYAAEFVCRNKKIRKIVLCYKEIRHEQVLVLHGGKTYAVLVSDNFVMAGIDADGRRYADIDITVTPVFKNRGLSSVCKKMCPDNDIIKMREGLALLDRNLNGDIETYEMLGLLAKDEIRQSFKKDIIAELIRYYGQRKGLVPEALLNVDKSLIGFDDRALFIDMLAVHERYQKAFQMMQAYGWKNVSINNLMETTSRMIADLRFDRNEMLLDMARDCFNNGCFNQRILEYLLYNYNGDSQTMLSLWRTAVASGCKRYDFSERVLSQLIFTNNNYYLDEVFAVYYEENRKEEVLVQAYLAIKGREYLEEDKEVPERIFEVTEQFVSAGRRLADVTRLALCKYYSAVSGLSQEQKNICGRFIHEFCHRGIILSFFQKLSKWIELPDGLENKIIIEYLTKTKNTVFLRTRIMPDNENWQEEELVHVFEGFCTKVITLLSGEVLEYEIMDDEDGLVRSGTYTPNEESAGILGCGRNIMINRMLDARAKKDMSGIVLNAQSYVLLDEVTADIFTLK